MNSISTPTRQMSSTGEVRMARQGNKGSLLIEILIALALFAGVSLIIGESLSTGLLAERRSHERETARRIAEEEVARVRATADISWSSLANLSASSSYAMNQDGSIASGTLVSTIDGITFTRKFTVTVATRDRSSGNGDALTVQSSTSSTITNDKGSLLAKVTVSWGAGNLIAPVVVDTLLSRWRNIVCGQSDWSASSTVSVRDCTSELAGASTKTNIQTGQTLQLCNGCN